MSDSFLNGDGSFPDVPMNPQPDCDDEECTCGGLNMSEFLPNLIPGEQFELGLGQSQLDERLVHVSHLATLIYCHRKFDGDGRSPSADGSVEAAWDIYNRTKKLVNEQDVVDLCDAKKLMAELDAASEADEEDG